MTQYINKSALVAELESKIKEWRLGSSSEAKFRIEVYKELSEWLDTLEVKDANESLRTEYEKGRADAIAQMQKEWSEEDKNFMYDTLSNLTELKDRYGEEYGNVGKCIDWLKSLKQRISP